MKISCLLVLGPVVGCALNAPDASEQSANEYRRQVSRIEVIEDFERRKRACSAAGGAVQLDRLSSGRLPPTRDEVRMAYCSRPQRP